MRVASDELRLPYPVRLGVLCGQYRCGPADPSLRLTDAELWWALRRPAGPVLLHVEAHGGRVHARAWGADADAVLAGVPALLGAQDRPDRFRPTQPAVAELHRRSPQLRLGRFAGVFDLLAAAAVQQKVTGAESFRSWATLVRRHGTPAPRPVDAPRLVAPPEPDRWRRLPVWEWRRAGVDGKRAATVRAAAEVADRLDALAVRTSVDADRLLRTLPGVGVWTSAEVRQRSHGDPDALSVGDWHVPRDVGYAFTGRPTDDDGMLTLLAPFSGQRHRVVRLISLAGISAPRRGPRRPLGPPASRPFSAPTAGRR